MMRILLVSGLLGLSAFGWVWFGWEIVENILARFKRTEPKTEDPGDSESDRSESRSESSVA